MLVFNLKKEWFEKIKSGKKTIEYREVKPYWTSRLRNATENVIHDPLPFGFPVKYGESEEYGEHVEINCFFQLGYSKKNRLAARITKIEVRNGLNTDLKINKLVYAIHFTDVKEC